NTNSKGYECNRKASKGKVNIDSHSVNTKHKEDYYIVVSDSHKSYLSPEKMKNQYHYEEEEKLDNKVIRILLVEDEKILRKASKTVVESYLKNNNIKYEITECVDGAECIYSMYKAYGEGVQYDVILTDLNMNFIS